MTDKARNDPDGHESHGLSCDMLKTHVLSACVLLTCCLMVSMSSGTTAATSVFVVEFLEYFRESNFKTSWCSSIYMMIIRVSAPLWTILLTKMTHRQLLCVGIIATCTGYALSSFAMNIYHLYATYGFIAGIGMGIMEYLSVIYTSEFFVQHRYLAMGLVSTGGSIGTMYIPPMIHHFIEMYTWRGAMLLLGGFVLQTLILTVFFKPIQEKGELVVSLHKSGTVNEAFDEHEICEQNLHENGKVNNETSMENVMNTTTKTSEQSLKANKHIHSGSSTSFENTDHPSDNVEDNQQNMDQPSDNVGDNQQNTDQPSDNVGDNQQNTDQPSENVDDNQQNTYQTSEKVVDNQQNTTQKTLIENMTYIVCQWRFYVFAYAMLSSSFVLGTCLTFNMEYFVTVGIDKSEAVILVMLVGAGNIIGRFGGSIWAQCVKSRRTLMTLMANVTFAVSTAIMSQYTDYITLAIMTFIMGVAYGVLVVSVATLSLEIFGIEHLRFAYATALMIFGTGLLIGPVLTGILLDVTQDYTHMYLLCMAMSVSSAVAILPLFLLQRDTNHESTQQKNVSNQENHSDDTNISIISGNIDRFDTLNDSGLISNWTGRYGRLYV